MRKMVIIHLILLVASSVYAQVYNLQGQDASLMVIRNNETKVDEKAEGSPFIEDQFRPAKISDQSKTFMVRYNAFGDQMQVKIGSNIISLDNSTTLYTIIFEGGLTYETVLDQYGVFGYAVLEFTTAQGHKVYRKQNIKYSPKKEPATSYEEPTPAKYTRVKDYFMIQMPTNKHVEELPDREKKLRKFFSNSSLDAYLKSNKVDLDNIEDLKKMLVEVFN